MTKTTAPQNLLCGFAAPKPLLKGERRQPNDARPIRQAQRLSFVGQVNITASIGGLLSFCCPTTIPSAINPVIIHALKHETRLVCTPHIIIKILKQFPFCTRSDTPSAVERPGLAIGIRASLPHPSPNTPKPALYRVYVSLAPRSVGDRSISELINAKTSAGILLAALKTGGENPKYFPAHAFTMPHGMTLAAGPDTHSSVSKHSEIVDCLSSKIGDLFANHRDDRI